ncbi:MAG: hypothetical protein BWY15_00253 [Firmicutes bacterium ADurb.Bin193]|nr:MAG: hypothetical protein BWY15_00253 [Firmicutes bacterium ADurb.Bin193]
MVTGLAKNKAAIFILVVLILATAINLAYFKTVHDNLKSARKALEYSQQELHDIESIGMTLLQLEEQEFQIKNKYLSFGGLFPKELPQENALNMLKILSDKAGVNISNISFDAVEKHKTAGGIYMNIKFSFKGDYLAIRSFVNLLNNNSERVGIKQLSFKGVDNNLDGSAVVAFYGYLKSPAPPRILEDYPFKGKVDLFSIFEGGADFLPKSSGDEADSVADRQTPRVKPYDFYIIMNSNTDDAANIIVGKNKQTEIFADGNKTNWINLYFATRDGKFYYRYRTPRDVYPKTEPNAMVEFSPVGKDISVVVFSNAILSDDDMSRILLNVYNDSGRKVSVTVTGPDGIKRVTQNITSGDVEVNYE